MIISKLKSIIPVRLKERGREVEHCLIEYNLIFGARRLNALEQEAWSVRLKQALEKLGPVFALFGRYISTRPDILNSTQRKKLAEINDYGPASSLTTIRTLFKSKFGQLPDDVFVEFETEPFISRLLFQKHKARLKDGQLAVVKFIHPEIENYLKTDLDLLDLLYPAFVGKCADSIFDQTIKDFCWLIKRQTDFGTQAKHLLLLGQDAENFELLKMARVYQELCSSNILTVEALRGITLKEVIRQAQRQNENLNNVPSSDNSYKDVACDLLFVWLRQTQLGRLFPIDPGSENIVILPDRRITFTDCVFDRLPESVGKNLLAYLGAVEAEEPDRACHFLFKAISRDDKFIEADELRRLFRQVTPFNPHESSAGYILENILSHWRLLTGGGYLLERQVQSFFQGIYLLCSQAQRIAPYSVSLKEGLQKMGLHSMFVEWQEMIGFQQIGGQTEAYLKLFLEMPNKFEDAVNGFSQHGAVNKAKRQEPGHRITPAIIVVSVIILFVIWAKPLAFDSVITNGANDIGSIAFLLVVIFLLQSIVRS